MTRVGLAGYGFAGRDIHAPLLLEAGCSVVAVSTGNPERAAAAQDDLPGVRVVPGLDELLAVPDLDLVVLATPSGGACRPGAAGRRRRPGLRRRQAARRGCGVRGHRGAPCGGCRRAAHRLPEPPLRRRAGDGRPRRRRRARRDAVPLRDALGAVAAGAEGPLARERHARRRAAASCSTCTATSSTPRCSCSAPWQRCSPRWRHGRPLPRTTPSSSAATPVGWSRTSGPPRSRVRPGPGCGCSGPRRRTCWPTSPARPTCGPDRPTPTTSTAAGSTGVRSASPCGAPRAGRPTSTGRSWPPSGPRTRQAAMPVDPWDAVHTLAVLDAARVSAAEERVVTVHTPSR